MSSLRKHSRLLAVAVTCVALGAGVGAIASAGAATGGSAKAPAAGKQTQHAKHGKHGKQAKAGGLRRYAARAVDGSVVVRTKDGLETVTFDRGKVDSVSGQQLTITEGTPKAAYKTVTLTIPANAVVRDDRQKATLADVKPGQRVLVLVAPKRTFVIARTPKTA
jgi:hypothetical protein